MNEAIRLIESHSIGQKRILVFSGAYSSLDFIYAQNNNILPVINNQIQLNLLLEYYNKLYRSYIYEAQLRNESFWISSE